MPLPDSDAEATVGQTVPPAEETPSTAPSPHRADLEHPWLGLESFREETRAYFFGRDGEIAEIHLRLRSHPLLVLYGRSGLGKTSILNAGLVPRLRSEGQRPISMRLCYQPGTAGDFPNSLRDIPAGYLEPDSTGVYGQFTTALFGGALGASSRLQWWRQLHETLGIILPEDGASCLWLRLHYRRDPPESTHLILDQFEDVFTLGASHPGAEEKVRDALAILLQGAIPPPISGLIAGHDTFLDHFDSDSVPVRVILSLRDDYVYALNRWRRHLPGLGQNNFELRALRGPAAFDAVFEPGELRCHYRGEVSEENKSDTGLPPIISEETARHIVRFVARKAKEVPIEEIEAVPPILSLLCRELNERRFTEPAGTPETPAQQIVFREGDTDVETIISGFYERCLAGRPEAVRIFIEEELVSYSGARLAQDEESILRVFDRGCEIPGVADGRRAKGFGDASKARACVEELVNRRLLTSLGDDENRSYELIHDLLAGVVAKSRTARGDRAEKEKAARQAEAERKAKEEAEASAREAADRAAVLDAALQKESQARKEADLSTRRARRLAVAVSVFAALAALALIAALAAQAEKERQRADAQHAKERAVASKKAADELIIFMQYDLRDTLGKLGQLSVMEEINTRIRRYHEKHPPEPGDAAAIDAADRERAVAREQQGEILFEEGHLAEAITAYRDFLETAERLGRKDPSNTLWQIDLSISYEKVGDVLQAQGDLAGALKSYRDEVAIREKLAKQDPGNADWQRDLSVSYNKVGDVLQPQGDLADALKSFRDGLAIVEKLSKQDPGNAGWQRDLSVSYNRVGDVLQAQGDLADALKSFRDGLAITEKLSKQDSGNARWQLDLSISYERVGDVLQAQGDLADALTSYRDEVAIHKKLAKQDPGNADWQRDLSVSYGKVGDVLQAQGDLAGALKSFRDEVAIREKLAKQDPGNARWQRDLSVSYNRVGDVLQAQGDLADALKSFRDGLAIIEKLSKQDPGNADWQGDLAWVYWRTGSAWAEVEPKSKTEALAMVEKGRDILRQLKERTGLTANQRGWLDLIEADLREMQKEK